MTDARVYPVIPARWDRHPHVTHHDLTATGVDGDAVLAGGLTLHRQQRHIRYRVTRDTHAVLRGVRHLFAHDRHSEEES